MAEICRRHPAYRAIKRGELARRDAASEGWRLGVTARRKRGNLGQGLWGCEKKRNFVVTKPHHQYAKPTHSLSDARRRHRL